MEAGARGQRGTTAALLPAHLQKQQKQLLLPPMRWQGTALAARARCALCDDLGPRTGARGVSSPGVAPGSLLETVLLAMQHSGVRGAPVTFSKRGILRAV